METLKNSRVAVFGIGGVGGHAADALVRSGIGEIDIIDSDAVAVSNINRQLIATHKTVGRKKVEVMKEHLLEINPEVVVHAHCCFFLPETEGQFNFYEYDYVIDAVDTVTAKLALAMACQKAGVPIVSSMGAGNKLDASAFEVADIYKTSVCPLAKVMRRELKKRGVKKLKVVYSKEEARTPVEEEGFVSDEARSRRATPGSVAFVPSVAGLILAGEVIRDLTGAGRKMELS
uniref:tRNA threonylcarbamoyladenosine dehydratase n=1 Tax=Agathobacter sp. TaxID=2021311 RepID=UPI0040563EF4